MNRYTQHRTLILLALLAVLTLGLTAAPAHAQQTTTIADMTILLWPEFDDPGMLVFYAGQVSPDVPLPVDLQFTLPPDVRINAVATEGQTGLTSIPYTFENDVLSLTSDNGSFHIEFYDPALDRSQPTRAYILNWAAPYDVGTLAINAQQPPDATDVFLQPVATTEFTDSLGLTNARATVDSLTAGEMVSIAMAYTKESDTLTADLIEQTAPAGGTTGGSTGSGGLSDLPDWVGYVLLGLGLIVIGGMVFWYFQTMRQPEPAPARRKKTSSSGRARPAASASRGGRTERFCTQCGKGVSGTDKFCRHCGTPLR